jgi:UDP-N-acetyl-D-galactosamine dehydrogenase
MAIVGLNHTGWSLLNEFAKDFNVIGYDESRSRIALLKEGINPFDLGYNNQNIPLNTFLTHNESDISEARFYIVTARSFTDDNYHRNLQSLTRATYTLARILKKRDFVVFANSCYPGCIEEVCIPILEAQSGLQVNKDFKVAYSPDKFGVVNRPFSKFGKFEKLISGTDNSTINQVCDIYNHITPAGVHKSSNIRLAEILKIIDFTQQNLHRNSVNYA